MELVALVEALQLVEIAAVLAAECSHFVFGEADEFAQRAGTGHREFREIGELGFGAAAGDRKNAGEIGAQQSAAHARALEETAQEVKVLVQQGAVVRFLPKKHVPFVNEDEEPPAGLGADAKEALGKRKVFVGADVGKGSDELRVGPSAQRREDGCGVVGKAGGEAGDVPENGVCLIEVSLVAGCFGDGERIKERSGVCAASGVVRDEHLGRVGFAKTTGPCVADEAQRRAKSLVHEGDEARLVHVRRGAQDGGEFFVAGIEVDAHGFCLDEEGVKSRR